MQWVNNIAARAALGFALVSGITATAVVGSAVLARNAADALERTLVAYSDDLLHASQAQIAAERMVAVGRGYLLTGDPELLVGVREAEAQLDVALNSLDRGDALPAERVLLQEVGRAAERYRKLLDDTFDTTPTAKDQDRQQLVADALHEKLLPAREDLDVRLENLVAHKQRLQVAARRRAAATAARSVRVTIGVGASALILSILLAALFTRRLADTYRREQASARRATTALAAKEELLGIVAHDLRSPLSAIVLRASSIVKGRRNPKDTSSAESIQAMCKRMSYLIQSLLDAASIEAGRMSVIAGRCALESVIAGTMESFGPAANEKSIRLYPVVEPRDLDVWADRERLFQVLSNLVGNALKFTPEGGEIEVSAREEAGRVKFEVRDTGPGIIPEHLPHVFERYWKSDGRSGRGSGLGLYIAKGIVEAHRGRIWVESVPGRGSSFQFELPTPPSRDDTPRPSPTVSSAPRQAPRRAFGHDGTAPR